jgi:serine/threonine-protein kinase
MDAPRNLSNQKRERMKSCPQCETGYPDSQTACPTHGHLLNEIRELRPGMVIHKTYRIVRKLGQGGMGTVYLAQHTLMDEPRALKFLSPMLSRDAAFTARFLREERTLRQIRNRNVVDCGDLEAAEDDSLFFSMEFVDGPDLRGLMHNTTGPLPAPLALSIARQIAEGLGAAHLMGMVHRDIKPENILMTLNGNVWIPKIADFGIVATKESSTAYTRTGGTLLTMAYAAPEQWRGTPAAELDGRTDLYALGGLLYEMLTGQTPFQAENYEGWAEQHRNATPKPPSTLRPELAHWRGLDALVLRMLAKDRNGRPANVAELLTLIDTVVYAVPQTRRATEPVTRQTTKQETRQATEKERKQKHKQLSTRKADKETRRTIPKWMQIGIGFIMVSLAIVVLVMVFRSMLTNETSTPSAETTNNTPATQQQPAARQNSPAKIAQQAEALYKQKNYSQARPLFDQACNAGVSSACNSLGQIYQQHLDVKQDLPRATKLYAKGCDTPGAEACVSLGEVYEWGWDTKEDDARALQLFSDACNAGNMHGCYNLGFMYDAGDRVTRDYSHAYSLYVTACNGGYAEACRNLGFLYREGNGVAKDADKGRQFMNKSCALGMTVSCEDVKRPPWTD